MVNMWESDLLYKDRVQSLTHQFIHLLNRAQMNLLSIFATLAAVLVLGGAVVSVLYIAW